MYFFFFFIVYLKSEYRSIRLRCCDFASAFGLLFLAYRLARSIASFLEFSVRRLSYHGCMLEVEMCGIVCFREIFIWQWGCKWQLERVSEIGPDERFKSS